MNCQKAGKTQGLGLNHVPWEVLAWCKRETCQILSNGNKQGRKRGGLRGTGGEREIRLCLGGAKHLGKL